MLGVIASELGQRMRDEMAGKLEFECCCRVSGSLKGSVVVWRLGRQLVAHAHLNYVFLDIEHFHL